MTYPNPPPVKAVTLVGGGPWGLAQIERALTFAPRLMAADGGANRLMAMERLPEAVFGDLDSLSKTLVNALGAKRIHKIPEQATTDFDKALRSIEAPFILGLGFLGGRMDHSLAALNTLVRHTDRPCILMGAKDLTFAAPARKIHLKMRRKDRLSLFPLSQLRGTSSGLRWPIAGLDFAPNGFIGTSNEVDQTQVSLEFDKIGMLVTLPLGRLDAAIAALTAP